MINITIDYDSDEIRVNNPAFKNEGKFTFKTKNTHEFVAFLQELFDTIDLSDIELTKIDEGRATTIQEW